MAAILLQIEISGPKVLVTLHNPELGIRKRYAKLGITFPYRTKQDRTAQAAVQSRLATAARAIIARVLHIRLIRMRAPAAHASRLADCADERSRRFSI